MPPNDLEDELLRRFQALTAPSHVPSAPSFKDINDEQARKAKEEDDYLERIADGRPFTSALGKGKGGAEDEMARRMAMLKGIEYDEVEVDEGDHEVDDFIASLAGTTTPAANTHQTLSNSNDTANTKSDAKNIEREARDALKATSGYIDASADKEDEDDVEDEEDFETEDEILLRALEEAELDAEIRSKNPRKVTEEDEVPYEKETEQDILARARILATSQPRPPSPNETDESPFSFPSLPTHIPNVEEETDKEAAAKMALLLSLSRPTANPGPRLPSPPRDRKPGQGWNLPGYKDDNDEDPDSWCCICNKDAEVACLGCEGDPYCEECWVEGHVGEKHRTKRFASRGGRKAVGA